MAKATTATPDGSTAQFNSPRVPLKMIRENPAALRGVDKESEDYVTLVDSVKARGVLNPIVVRKLVDPETQEVFFGLVDGLHRYSAAQDAGLTEIPVNIIEADEYEALETQIITNVHKVNTKPIEFTKGIQRLMAANPLMTELDLAKKLNMSPKWISERLGLLNLAEPIQKLVNDGTINLSNAYALSKLKAPDEQAAFLDRAQTMSPTEFAPAVQARVKEINDAKRQGRAANPPGFSPQAFLQKLSDIKEELDHPKIGEYLHGELAPRTKRSDYLQGWKDAISWTLHMDAKSVEAQKAAWDQEQERKKTAAAQREKDKLEKRAQAATQKAEETRKELAALQA